MYSALSPPVDHSFWPLTTQSPPSRTARVEEPRGRNRLPARCSRAQSCARRGGSRQPLLLLRLGAVQKQRLRDDRLAGAVRLNGRAGVRHLGDEGDLLGGAAALAAELLWPADADPAVAAHQLGEFRVPAALLEGLAQMRRAPFGRPVFGQPAAHLLAEGIGGGAHVVSGKGGHVAGPSTKSASAARARATPPKRARSACTRRKCRGASCSSA